MAVTGNIRPLAGHIGAEISGIDLRHLDDGKVTALRETWLEHKVVTPSRGRVESRQSHS